MSSWRLDQCGRMESSCARSSSNIDHMISSKVQFVQMIQLQSCFKTVTDTVTHNTAHPKNFDLHFVLARLLSTLCLVHIGTGTHEHVMEHVTLTACSDDCYSTTSRSSRAHALCAC